MLLRSLIVALHQECWRYQLLILLGGEFLLGWGQLPAPDVKWRPQVIGVLMVHPNEQVEVTWTYDRVVPLAQVQEQLQQFRGFLNCPLEQPTLRVDSLKRHSKPGERFTVVGFRSRGLVDLNAGTIWLDPFLKCFAQYKHLQLYVLLPREVAFKGYPYFESPQLQSWVEVEPRLWRCTIRLHGHDPALLTVPRLRPDPVSQVAPARLSKSWKPRVGFWAWGVALSFLFASLTGLGIYLALRRYARRLQHPTPPPDQTHQPSKIPTGG